MERTRTNKVCSVTGCDKLVVARGWCRTHYYRWNRNGHFELLSKKAQSCSVEGCGGAAVGWGWCGKHYSRWKTHGALECPARTAKPKQACSVDNCDRVVVARGWCSSHYTKWYQTGSPDTPSRSLRICSVEGCDRKHKSLGWCDLHYKQQYRENLGAYREKTCSVDGCGKVVSARGWCTTHYMRWRAAKQGTIRRPNDEATLAYHRAHKRVYSARGPARSWPCTCGSQAREWAYTHDCVDERQSALGPYSNNPSDYVPLCSSCHKRMDRAKAREQSS